MTSQIREVISFQGATFLLPQGQEPLEPLFFGFNAFARTDAKLAPGHSQVERPEFCDSPDGELWMVSSCDRGYVGEWEVRKGVLYLNEVRSPVSGASFFHLIFPSSLRPISARWFTGRLSLINPNTFDHVFELAIVGGELDQIANGRGTESDGNEVIFPEKPLAAKINTSGAWKLSDYARAVLVVVVWLALARHCSPGINCEKSIIRGVEVCD